MKLFVLLFDVLILILMKQQTSSISQFMPSSISAAAARNYSQPAVCQVFFFSQKADIENLHHLSLIMLHITDDAFAILWISPYNGVKVPPALLVFLLCSI